MQRGVTIRTVRWIVWLRGLVALAVGVPLGATTRADEGQPLRAMTFNIRFDNPKDGVNAWPNRRDLAASTFRFHRVDVAGLQEALHRQINDLAERLPDFAWVGVGRDDGKTAGEFSPIFYRKSRCELLEHATFWLSDQPEKVGSQAWDAALPRIVTWAKFKDKASGKTFYAFNTHFDHRGAEARKQSAALILERVAKIAGDAPVVVTGDLNLTESEAPYKVLTLGAAAPPDGKPLPTALRDARHVAREGHHGGGTTFNGFERWSKGEKIDYIFVKNKVRVLRHGVLAENWEGRFVSDHFPVVADVEWE